MPVILPVAHYDLWLDPGFKNTADLRELLRPFEAGLRGDTRAREGQSGEE